MPRRYGIILAFVLLAATVAVVGAVQRSAGQKALAAVLEKHATAGYGSSVTDLAAMAPPVGRERQERLLAWMRTTGRPSPSYTAPRTGEPITEETRKAHDAFRPEIDELEQLLGEGDLCLTSLGWLPEDLETASIMELVGGYIPNLLRMRSAWNWYAAKTRLAEDPSEALATLQRLHESTARTGCLIDGMIAVACDAIRDDAIVVLATEGRCPEEVLELWLAEPPRAAQLVADGLRGERLRFAAPLAHELIAGGLVSEHLEYTREVESLQGLWDEQVRPWVEAASDCAAHLEAIVAVELHIRGEIERSELDPWLAAAENLGHPFSLMMPNAEAALQVATSCADRHVMVRTAVALARAAAERGEVPVTAEEALAGLAEGRPAVRYHRLADDRFRVTMDPDDTGEPRAPTDREAYRPLVLRHDFVEIQIR